jgi:hypothetical protein
MRLELLKVRRTGKKSLWAAGPQPAGTDITNNKRRDTV